MLRIQILRTLFRIGTDLRGGNENSLSFRKTLTHYKRVSSTPTKVIKKRTSALSRDIQDRKTGIISIWFRNMFSYLVSALG